MSESAELRPGKGAVVIGVLLFLVSPLSLLFAFAFVQDRGGDPAASGAVQWLFTSAWLITTGVLLVRRARARLFAISAGLALCAGVVGLLTWVPLSFGNANQAAIDEQWDPLGFVAWALAAALAGAGHVQQARRGAGAGALHVVALLVVVAGVLHVVARHA